MDARATAGEPRELQVLGLAAALRRADLPQQCSDRSSADLADGDDAVIDLHAAIAATHRGAEGPAAESDIFQCCLGTRSDWGVKLGRIEIRQADLDPSRRIWGIADAQAVAVTHVTDLARKGVTGASGDRCSARIRS